MLENRRITQEIMDDPALPASTYTALITDLAKVNRITLAHRPTLHFLSQAIGERRQFSVLDVGYGHGDMLRAIARWAKKRGLAAKLVGVDLNTKSEAAARAATDPAMAIDFRTGDYALQNESFDFVISSLVAHHMSDDQLAAFLRFMDRETRCGWFINDLHRHGFAYAGYPLLARLMGWHEIVRKDGHTSIARSYRPEEWPPILAAAGIAGAQIRRYFPFRLCVAKIH